MAGAGAACATLVVVAVIILIVLVILAWMGIVGRGEKMSVGALPAYDGITDPTPPWA